MGWSNTANGNVEYTDKSLYTYNYRKAGQVSTLYAIWDPIKNFTIRFDSNGGVGSIKDQVMSNNAYNALSKNTYTKIGYSFLGWDTDESADEVVYKNQQVFSNYTGETNGITTLYAVWKGNSYTVTFNANGGVGSMSKQSFTYETSQALSTNSFSKSGYVFSGWNTKANGSGITYTNGQEVSTLVSTNKGNITLYAMWSKANKIAIITGTVTNSLESYNGALALQEKYGEDVVVHSTYPDNYNVAINRVVSTITQYADDPEIKAIIVTEAVPGTVVAFQQIKQERPDILCFAGESQEDFDDISEYADLVIYYDSVALGYLSVKSAHDLGCDTFVQCSFPRHLSINSIKRRTEVMRQACEEFDMEFIQLTVSDPIDASLGGTQGAIAYMAENVPLWVEEYGENTAFYCTNDAETEPLIAGLLEHGGYFIGSDLPSVYVGYPNALSLNMTNIDTYAETLNAVEEEIVNEGGFGRFGTWYDSYYYCLANGLGELAINAVNGGNNYKDVNKINQAFKKSSSGNNTWNSHYFYETSYQNIYGVYQDTYMFGTGFMSVTNTSVPEKYYDIED